VGKKKTICFACSLMMTLHGKENGKFFIAEWAKYVYHFKNIKEGFIKQMHQYDPRKYVDNSN